MAEDEASVGKGARSIGDGGARARWTRGTGPVPCLYSLGTIVAGLPPVISGTSSAATALM